VFFTEDLKYLNENEFSNTINNSDSSLRVVEIRRAKEEYTKIKNYFERNELTINVLATNKDSIENHSNQLSSFNSCNFRTLTNTLACSEDSIESTDNRSKNSNQVPSQIANSKVIHLEVSSTREKSSVENHNQPYPKKKIINLLDSSSSKKLCQLQSTKSSKAINYNSISIDLTHNFECEYSDSISNSSIVILNSVSNTKFKNNSAEEETTSLPYPNKASLDLLSNIKKRKISTIKENYEPIKEINPSSIKKDILNLAKIYQGLVWKCQKKSSKKVTYYSYKSHYNCSKSIIVKKNNFNMWAAFQNNKNHATIPYSPSKDKLGESIIKGIQGNKRILCKSYFHQGCGPKGIHARLLLKESESRTSSSQNKILFKILSIDQIRSFYYSLRK